MSVRDHTPISTRGCGNSALRAPVRLHKRKKRWLCAKEGMTSSVLVTS